MIKLKKDIVWERLDEFGDFCERTLFTGIDDIPDDLRWYSYWKNTSPHGFIEFIEVNIGTREIRCQGCLEVLFDMIKADIVEKIDDNGSYCAAMGYFKLKEEKGIKV